MDSYSCAVVQCFYVPFENFTSHFVAILEIANFLGRIKIMNPFVKKHFTISAKNMILFTFFPCILFGSFYALCYAPYVGGEFYYFDSNGIKRVNSFWFDRMLYFFQKLVTNSLSKMLFLDITESLKITDQTHKSNKIILK